jgi:putative ATP-binding cassette transporter
MSFVRLVLADAGTARIWLIITTLLSGLSMGAMLVVVNTVIDNVRPSHPSFLLISLFIAACASFVVAKSYALNLVTFIVGNLVDRWRVRIISRMRDMDLASFERIGGDRIALVLTRELQVLSDAGPALVHAATTTTMLLVTSLYVAQLSLLAFLAIVLALTAAVQLYRLTQARTRDLLDRSVVAEDVFSKSFHHMIDGFREVKLSQPRSDDLFFNHVVRSSEQATSLKVEAGRQMGVGDNVINIVFYVLVGYIVFILPNSVGSSETASKLINVILFSVGAVELVVRGLPMLGRSAVAIDTLETLERDIRGDKSGEETRAAPLPQTFTRIEGHDLYYSYRAPDGDRSFAVGPLNLEINQGEVIFIVGGNGSGKSTLLMLLTRLYEPEHGFILWDGVPVDSANARNYRHLFSAIFSDFHLFDRLYGLPDVDERVVGAMIEELRMADKVRFAKGRFSTLDLSTGQRKRLAMIVAQLENRPILVFDEWAADQDPTFRRFFYESLVPALRENGRTVIAVTHDDRFFATADRVLVMDKGKLDEGQMG